LIEPKLESELILLSDRLWLGLIDREDAFYFFYLINFCDLLFEDFLEEDNELLELKFTFTLFWGILLLILLKFNCC